MPDREPAQSGGDGAQLRAAVARFSAALGACDAEPGLASIGELIARLGGGPFGRRGGGGALASDQQGARDGVAGPV